MVAGKHAMAVPTTPHQPVIYDMMLLAHALIRLHDFENRKVGRHHKEFCERQTVFENACTKIRAFSQFIQPKKDSDLIKITDSEFGGVANSKFIGSHFDAISKYVSHLHEQRWKKESRCKRPTAADVMKGGKEILDYLKPLMDSRKPQFTGDAAKWYGVFESLYPKLSSLPL